MQIFCEDLYRLLNFAYTCRKFQDIYGKSDIKKSFGYEF